MKKVPNISYLLFKMVYSIFFWSLLIVALFFIPIFAMIFYPLFFNRRRSYRFVFMLLSRLWLYLLLLIPKVKGKGNIPKKGSVLLISNHHSIIDLLLLNAVSTRFINIFSPDISMLGLFDLFNDGAGLLREGQNNPFVSAMSIRRAIELINEKDEALAIFPAGMSWKKEDAEKPLSKGLYRILEETDPVIIPVNIKKGYFIELIIRHLRPEIVFGEPIRKEDVLNGRDRYLRDVINNLGK